MGTFSPKLARKSRERKSTVFCACFAGQITVEVSFQFEIPIIFSRRLLFCFLTAFNVGFVFFLSESLMFSFVLFFYDSDWTFIFLSFCCCFDKKRLFAVMDVKCKFSIRIYLLNDFHRFNLLTTFPKLEFKAFPTISRIKIIGKNLSGKCKNKTQ